MSRPPSPWTANIAEPLMTGDPTDTPSGSDIMHTGNSEQGFLAATTPHTTPSTSAKVQYAIYPEAQRLPSYNSAGGMSSNEKERSWMADAYVNGSRISQQTTTLEPWVPMPLRTWFWVPLVCVMAGGGIALEVALHFSKHNRGWGTKGDITSTSGVLHYVYTLPPVAVSMILAGLWAWTDIEIRKLQPYVDLAQGDAPPQRSLLLDYTRTHTMFVWTIAARNRHWVVSLASILVLITLGFQPLSAALFNVQDVFWTNARSTINSLAQIGLNQDQNFDDLTSFLTAAGYASANVQFNFGDPEYTYKGYTIAPFELPDIANGTLVTNTTAILSQPNCVNPDQLNMVQLGNGSWSNSATFSGCTFQFRVDKTTKHLFGSAPINETSGCEQFLSQPPQFQPTLFWYFTYDTTPASSNVTMCTPSISLWDTEVTLDFASRNITNVRPLGPLGSNNGTDPALAQLAGNITGAPLNGRAYNGLYFNLTNPDQFTVARQDAIALMLPAAVLQAAEQDDLTQAFVKGIFSNLTQNVYTTYLTLLAQTVYFLPSKQPILADTMVIRKRLFLSPVAVHLLSSAMFVLAVFGTILHLWHRQERQVLRLAHAPGTIASAVSLGGGTGVGNVLAGRQREEDMYQALRDKRFRIDVRTNKIVMEGEPGYEDATSPNPERLAFGIPRSLSVSAKRLSTGLMGGVAGPSRRRTTAKP